jgi:4'-phosphopantetheinyl transferase
MQKSNDGFSRAVTTIRSPLREVGCVLAWALDYARHGSPHVEMLASPAIAHMPNEDEVMVWFGVVDSDIGTVRAATIALLDPEEEYAAMRLQHAADRCASLAAHAAVRLMLSAATELAPSRIRIYRGRYGKPLLAGGGLHFSLAHVRGVVAAVLARQPVGIDIERLTAVPDISAVAATIFAPESCKALDAVEGEARLAMFYRFWTLSEAFTKATGMGVFQGLDSFAFTGEGEAHLTRVTAGWGRAERWRFGLC